MLHPLPAPHPHVHARAVRAKDGDGDGGGKSFLSRVRELLRRTKEKRRPGKRTGKVTARWPRRLAPKGAAASERDSVGCSFDSLYLLSVLCARQRETWQAAAPGRGGCGGRRRMRRRRRWGTKRSFVFQFEILWRAPAIFFSRSRGESERLRPLGAREPA